MAESLKEKGLKSKILGEKNHKTNSIVVTASIVLKPFVKLTVTLISHRISSLKHSPHPS